MKILQVVDIYEWAIGKLARSIEEGNQHIKIKTIAIHPKDLRNNPDKWISYFKEQCKEWKADLVHFHYWDSANTLAPHFEGKKILTHHNQKNLLSHDWSKFDAIVCHTRKAKDMLSRAGYLKTHIIQHGIDIEENKFLDEYDERVRSIGYIGRIVPWKGLYEIAKAAKELDSEVICLGRIDKGDYWQRVQEYADVLDIRFNTPDEEKVKVIHEFGLYVGNSSDNIEEGTLGLLEVMACGIPVVTTPSGEAQDIIKDGENGILVDFEDYNSLKHGIERFYSMTKEQKESMRQKAWDTVRQMSKEKMAYQYGKLYASVIYEKDSASVIIPTYNRTGTITKILDAYREQTYRPLEIIVSDDNSTDDTSEVVMKWKEENDIPLKYIQNQSIGYGLAQARNEGIMQASGHYLIFNDDRIIPENDAVARFVKRLSGYKEKSAIWGNKGAGKRDFIENFFCIRKNHISEAGMFNERINCYGGQSQEIRNRLRVQGFRLEYEPSAKGSPVIGSRKSKRRYDIFKSKLKLWKLAN